MLGPRSRKEARWESTQGVAQEGGKAMQDAEVGTKLTEVEMRTGWAEITERANWSPKERTR